MSDCSRLKRADGLLSSALDTFRVDGGIKHEELYVFAGLELEIAVGALRAAQILLRACIHNDEGGAGQ